VDAIECTVVYDHLVDYLQDNSLTWVVDQINDTLALGKISTKKVKPFRDLAEKGSRPPSTYEQTHMLTSVGYSLPVGSETELTASLDYSPRERLALLIQAIETAVMETVAMERATIETLNSLSDQEISRIIFVSEQNDNRRHIITADDTSRRDGTVSQLRQLLLQLKAII
jgi:hypothetical protein